MPGAGSSLCAIVLVGCDAQHPANAPIATQDLTKGYRLQRVKADPDNPGDVLVILTLSGGGTRAAALAYGTMEALRDVKLKMGGRSRRLLDEVDVINAVSGGSIVAAYYAVHREGLFRDFESRFLKRDVERQIRAEVFANLPRLAQPQFSRGEVLAEYFDRELFDGATYSRPGARQHAAVRGDQRFRFGDRCAVSVYAGAIRPALLGPGQRVGRTRRRCVRGAATFLRRDHYRQLRRLLWSGVAAGDRREDRCDHADARCPPRGSPHLPGSFATTARPSGRRRADRQPGVARGGRFRGRAGRLLRAGRCPRLSRRFPCGFHLGQRRDRPPTMRSIKAPIRRTSSRR